MAPYLLLWNIIKGDEMGMKKLKPCPFCDGKAITAQIELNHESILNETWIVGCDGIYGSLCPGYIYKCSPFYISRELAVKMWNNRELEKGVNENANQRKQKR